MLLFILNIEEKRASLLIDDASNDLDKSGRWGLMGKRALKHRVSLAVAGLRLFVLALLSALLIGCGGGGSGRQHPPQS